MKIEVLSAAFKRGVVDSLAREDFDLPEIAVVGRSNVGKSSFINYLLGKSLARTSSTPGHTREINLFDVTIATGGVRTKLILADLPGFGFAKLSKAQREKLGLMTIDYIRNTPSLKVVILLIDSKREPEADEAAIQREVAEVGAHMLVIATKIDRLSRSDQSAALRRVSKPLGFEPQDILVSGDGKFNPQQVVWQRILPLIE